MINGVIVKRGNKYAVVKTIKSSNGMAQKWICGLSTKTEAQKTLLEMCTSKDKGED